MDAILKTIMRESKIPLFDHKKIHLCHSTYFLAAFWFLWNLSILRTGL